MVTGEAAARFLAAPFLADVPAELRQAVLDSLEERRIEAGTVFLTQGEPSAHLSFLIEGQAAIDRASVAGRREILATLSAPAMFGTTSFFHPTKPSFSVRAVTDGRLLTLDHPGHETLRRAHPEAAEALALAALRVLSERFEMLDQRISEYLAEHPDDHPKVTEWAGFRARLFEEPNF